MRVLFALLCITLFWTGCTNDPKTNGGDDGPTHVKASPIAPFIGLWSYSVAMTSNATRKKDYEGRWIEFKGDGTFTNGRWGEQTNTGTFTFDTDKTFLNLDYKNDELDQDMDWAIKLGGDVIIWLGNASLNRTGDQIRMQKVQERPAAPAGIE